MSRVTIDSNAPYSVIVSKEGKGASQHILLLNDGTELKSQLNKAVLCGRRPSYDGGWVVNKNPAPNRLCSQCRRVMKTKEETEG